MELNQRQAKSLLYTLSILADHGRDDFNEVLDILSTHSSREEGDEIVKRLEAEAGVGFYKVRR